MAKSTDFPITTRDFGMALSKFSHRHYDYDIFTDFIDYVICCLLWDGDPETVERLKRKYEADYDKFKELYVSFLGCMTKNLGPDDSFEWYDVLGEIYEVISSSSKASALGQFFTPKPLCDMMAKLTAPDTAGKPADEKLKVNDCACGSGRTLLSYNRFNPGQLLYGEDFDPICSKMATVNLAIHGCKGQVCNMDSLRPDEWYFGFEINPRLFTTGGIPHIFRIQKEQSYTWQHWQVQRQHTIAERQEQASSPAVEIPKANRKSKTEQLTLF